MKTTHISKNTVGNTDPKLVFVAVLALVLALIIGLSVFLASTLPSYDSRYGNYDTTGEEYDIYLPDYIKVCNYDKIKLPDLKYTPTDKDFEDKLVYYKAMYCNSINDPDRPAKANDSIAINSFCKFTDNGEKYSLLTFKEGSNGWGRAFILGINQFYTTEIDDAIIGMRAGETKTVTFKLPDPYYKDLMNSGREVEMEIKLVYIDEIDYSEADVVDHETGKDFYAENYGYQKDMFFEKIRYDLETEYDDLIKNYKETLVYNYLNSHSEVKKMPEEIYEKKYEATVNNARITAQGKEMTLLEYVNSIGYDTLDDYYAYVKESTESAIKLDMICYFIIRCEGLKLDETYYNQQILDIASNDYYEFKEVEEAESYLDSLYGLDYVKTEIFKQYAIKYIADKCGVSENINTVFDNNLGFTPSWK